MKTLRLVLIMLSSLSIKIYSYKTVLNHLQLHQSTLRSFSTLKQHFFAIHFILHNDTTRFEVSTNFYTKFTNKLKVTEKSRKILGHLEKRALDSKKLI